jgi:hypothetical protein
MHRGGSLTILSRSSAKSLEAESGIMLEHTSIIGFRKAILSGDWKNAERLLIDGLKYGATKIAAMTRSLPMDIDVVLRDPQCRGLDVSAGTESRKPSLLKSSVLLQSIKFLLHQQRYLELLEARQTRKALSILRNRLAPLNHGSDRLHQLSRCHVCHS